MHGAPGAHFGSDGVTDEPSAGMSGSDAACGVLPADVERAVLKTIDEAVRKHRSGGSWPVSGFFMGIMFSAAVLAFMYWRYRSWLDAHFRRDERSAAMRALDNMDPETLKRILSDVELPSWLAFPDVERVGWVNTVVKQLWPHVARAVQDAVEAQMGPLLRDNKPRWLGDVKMTRFTMGSKAPEIVGVKVYNGEDVVTDGTILECDVRWDSDLDLELVTKPIPRKLGFLSAIAPLSDSLGLLSNVVVVKSSLEELTANGKVRIALRPLINRPPIIGAVKVSLLGMPDFDYRLSVYHGDLSLVPGLDAWLRTVLGDAVFKPYILPDGYTCPLAPGALAGDLPKGILIVTLVEATDVPAMDWFSASDVFVQMYVRANHKQKSSVKDNASHPVWDPDGKMPFVFAVHEPDAQVLTAEIMDWDYLGSEKIGVAEIPIRELPEGQEKDLWLPVNRPDHKKHRKPQEVARAGELQAATRQVLEESTRTVKEKLHTKGRHRKQAQLHLRVRWEPIGHEDIAQAQKGEANSAALDYLQGGILYVNVKRATNLPRKPLYLGGSVPIVGSPHSKVKVRVDGLEKWSPSGHKGADKRDVVFDSQLEFILPGSIANNRQERVVLEVWDTRFKDFFQGSLEVSLDDIKRRHRLKDVFRLSDSTGALEAEFEWYAALEMAR